MDPLIIILLVVIVLSSGGIGVLADSLGRKMGKKKLSFRSMRPKHVARLGTFIAGMLVSVVTLLMVYLSSSDVREWIIRGRAAIREANQLTEKNRALEADINGRTARINALNTQAQVAEAKLVSAQTRLTSVQKDLTQANARYETAKRSLAEGKRRLLESQNQLKKNQELLVARQADLGRISKKLVVQEARYVTLSRNYSEVDKERTEANEKVSELNRQADVVRKEMAQLKAESAQLVKDKQSALDELADYQAKLKSSAADVTAKREELDNLNRELDLASQNLVRYQILAGTSRKNPMVFRRDQEIARIELGPHLTRTQAQDALNRLVRKASLVAEKRGAITPRGSEYCVGFWDHPLPSGETFSAADQQEAVVETLTNFDSNVVLIARAYLNAFQGEFVPLDVRGYRDPVVYRKGEILAELHVEKNTPVDKVLVQFNDFMKGTVRQQALKRGMIPVEDLDDNLIAEVEPSKTIDLVQELANSVRNVRLQVLARSDTRAADSLQLEFVIK